MHLPPLIDVLVDSSPHCTRPEARLLGVWLFTFLTVFAGGISFGTVGARIQIWSLVFNVVAVLFVYFECPDVRSRQMPLSSSEADLNSPLAKQLKRSTRSLPKMKRS